MRASCADALLLNSLYPPHHIILPTEKLYAAALHRSLPRGESLLTITTICPTQPCAESPELPYPQTADAALEQEQLRHTMERMKKEADISCSVRISQLELIVLCTVYTLVYRVHGSQLLISSVDYCGIRSGVSRAQAKGTFLNDACRITCRLRSSILAICTLIPLSVGMLHRQIVCAY
jgi:hypothetical protein